MAQFIGLNGSYGFLVEYSSESNQRNMCDFKLALQASNTKLLWNNDHDYSKIALRK